jgi:DNA-binding transcriptional ArsR family regulator
MAMPSTPDTAEPNAEGPDEGRLVRMFKALAHPNRLRLFEEIRQGSGAYAEPEARGVGGCLLQHVVDVLNIGAPTVSHHLRELVNAGLVHTERVGKQVHCQVVPEALREAAAFFVQSGAPAASTAASAAPSAADAESAAEHIKNTAESRNAERSGRVAPAGEPA